jgi:hypothetical protein
MRLQKEIGKNIKEESGVIFFFKAEIILFLV